MCEKDDRERKVGEAGKAEEVVDPTRACCQRQCADRECHRWSDRQHALAGAPKGNVIASRGHAGMHDLRVAAHEAIFHVEGLAECLATLESHHCMLLLFFCVHLLHAGEHRAREPLVDQSLDKGDGHDLEKGQGRSSYGLGQRQREQVQRGWCGR